MKRALIIIVSIILITITFIKLDYISDKLSKYIGYEPNVIIKEGNKYTKDNDYLFVKRSTNYIPYSYQDLLDIFYSAINNGWKQFTFNCPKEYVDCVDDVTEISANENTLTFINNYVHPFNSFKKVKTTISDSGEVNLKISYIYTNDMIEKIDQKTDEIINKNIKDSQSIKDKIKTIHDYIINNTKYDKAISNNEVSNYHSDTAYGPLFEGYAICNGYTDLMAIFLSKLGINNYKIATTKEQISYSNSGHIWNAVYVDNKWLHIDLTWDDPVSSNGDDYLYYTYFLVTTDEMHKADSGETVIEEHKFNPLYYLEFN